MINSLTISPAAWSGIY